MFRSHASRSVRVLGVLALTVAGVLTSALAAKADSFDWGSPYGFAAGIVPDNQSWLTPVKNQFGGTCWDFSAVGTMEAKYMLSRNDNTFMPDLSEQQVCWETNPDMGSTGGGMEMQALSYLTTHGVVEEWVIPHDPAHPDTPAAFPANPWPLTSVFPAPDSWTNHVFKGVSNQNHIPDSTEQLKAALKLYGPLLTTNLAHWDLYSSPEDLKANYRGLVEPNNNANAIDHAVMLVGYYDDPTMPTGGYWIIKNSWGTGNGNQGFNVQPYGIIEEKDRSHAETGPVYYTGSMATATWNGGSTTWTAAGNNWTNNADSSTYVWENKETSAVFNSSTGTAVALQGTVISHGLTISAGATGYSFSGGSLTVTAGGITANESTIFNSPVSVGAPQTWTIATGKNLHLGDVHTIISNLTIAGSGNTIISGSIDGGGVINIYGGAAPGAITKTGTGTLTLDGAGTYSAALSMTGGTLNFAQAAGKIGNFTGVISGNRPLTKNGAGTIILAAANNYSGTTTISDGAFQADSGVGLTSGSLLILDGGVIQSNGTTTFTRKFKSSSTITNRFQMTANGGGFSAGAGPMTVNMGGDLRTISWSNTAGTNLCGPLKFGSLSAANVTTFLNPINLNGGTRTIQVANNSATNADYVVISSVISNSSGTYGIHKTGDGLLILSGDNTFNGPTTVAGGALQANFGLGIPGLLNLSGGVLQSSITDSAAVTFDYSVGTTSGQFQWNTGGGGFSAGAGPLTVNVGGNATPSTLVWGTTVGTNLVGPLKLGSATSMNTTTVQNPIDLNGADRTINVDDNIASNADYSAISGVLSNSIDAAGLQKTGSGLLLLTAANTYNGTTTIAGGSLQAELGVGLPDASLLSFNGGVFQNNSATTFARTLGTASGNVQWEAGGGGFAAGGGALTVNVGGEATPSTLVWGTAVGTNLHGPLMFGSSSAQYTTTFQNAIDLGGADRTIQIQDNPDSTGDNVVLSGNISGTGGLTIAGTGAIKFTGASNTYSGATTVSCGTLDLAATTGPAIPHDLNITSSGSAPTQVRIQAANQIAASANINFGGTSAEARLLLLGRSLTVAGISDASGLGVIENTDNQTASNVTLVVNAATNCSFNGTLRNTATGSGTLMLAKTGAGTLTLSGSNIAHTGSTSNLAGRLVLQDTTNAAFLATNIVNNAALEFNLNSADVAFAKTINGSGSLNKTGARTLTLEGATISYYGGTTVDAGKLILKNTSNGTFLSRSIVNNAAVEFNTTTTNLTMSGPISGSGTLAKTGANTLTLSGSAGNTYTGATTHSQGVLVLNKTSGYAIPGDLNFYAAGDSAWIYLYQNNQFSPNTVINFQGGYWPHLVLYGHSTTVAGISDPYGTAVIENTQDQSAAAATFTVNNTNDYSYAGHIRNTAGGSGTLALVKGGSGKLTLAGDVCGSYTGGLTVNAGTLDYSGGALPAAPYTLNGGTLDIGTRSQSIGLFRLAGGTLAGTGTLTSSSAYVIQAGTASAILGGTVGLNKTTAGTATINAPSYTGTTTVSLGTLQFTGSLPVGAYTISGGVLDIGAISQSIGLLRVAGGTINGTGTLTSSSTYDIQSGTVNASLAGSGIALSKTTSNTAILNAANAYTGTTTIALGALQADDGVGLPSASFLSFSGGVFQSNTATAFTRSLGTSGANNFQWLSGGGGFAAGGCPLTVNIGGGTPLLWGTTAGTNLVGTLKFGSTTAAYATTFQNALDINGATRTIQIDDNVNSTTDCAILTGAISNSAANSAGLNKTGAGTLVLAADNTYSGTTFVSSGTLQIGNGGTAGSLTGNILANATVVFNRSDDVVFRGTITGTGTLVKIGSATLTLAANNSFAGTTTINAGILEVGSGGTAGNIAGNIANNATLAFNRADSLAFAGNITGVGNVVKKGEGTLVLTEANTYGGGTTIDAGVLQIGDGGTTGSIAGNVVNNATLAFNRADDTAFDGVIHGTGVLVKDAANTLTLTAANTYGGGTAINAGTLEIGNGETAGSIAGNVANNATLAFNRSDNLAFEGIVSGTGGLVQKGAGSLILNAANTYTGPTEILSGALTLTATGQIDPQSAIDNNAALVIADGTHTLGNIAGTGTLLVGDTSVLTVASIVQDTLTIGGTYASYATPTPPAAAVAVPEPAAIISLLAALLALPLIRKRQKYPPERQSLTRSQAAPEDALSARLRLERKSSLISQQH